LDLAQWVKELGLPVSLLVFVAVCASRAGHFLAPLITRLAEKHCELIDTLKLHSNKQTDIMLSQNQVLSEHGKLLSQIHDAVINHDIQAR
jgi:hypothetical protein